MSFPPRRFPGLVTPMLERLGLPFPPLVLPCLPPLTILPKIPIYEALAQHPGEIGTRWTEWWSPESTCHSFRTRSLYIDPKEGCGPLRLACSLLVGLALGTFGLRMTLGWILFTSFDRLPRDGNPVAHHRETAKDASFRRKRGSTKMKIMNTISVSFLWTILRKSLG